MNLFSELIIDTDIDSQQQKIKSSNKELFFVERIVEGEFLIEDAMFAIEKAHISSVGVKCIILGAQKFSVIAQNKLLKVIEEPPKDVIFKLIAPTKTTILPTILSRLPVRVENAHKESFSCEIKTFGLEYIHNLLQQSKGVKPFEAKEMIESISKEAFKSKDFKFKQKDYDVLADCIKLLDVGSPTIFVLNTALLSLLEVKTRTLHADKKS